MRIHPGFSAFVLLAMLAFPIAASSQSEVDFRATIRQALLSDPRTAGMDEAEITAMVELLTAEAAEKGVTAEDVVWRPQSEATLAVADGSCSLSPRFLCSLNQAFGFDGSALLIPILLGATSMLLIVFFGYELERHYMRAHARKGAGAGSVPPLA